MEKLEAKKALQAIKDAIHKIESDKDFLQRNCRHWDLKDTNYPDSQYSVFQCEICKTKILVRKATGLVMNTWTKYKGENFL